MSNTAWTNKGLLFECDSAKRALNQQKHGIDLVAASDVFLDPFAVLEYDHAHSLTEERYSLTGTATSGVLLFVAFTTRGDRVRIISARKATKSEARKYERHK